MYELIKVTGRAYYIDCPSKVGIVKIADDRVVLIDSGNDKEMGKRIKRILDAEGWTLDAIYNTHSHADHIGANAYLHAEYGCKIYSSDFECASIRHPMLEPSLLYGGMPPKELCNKFLLADPSPAEPITEDTLPSCLSTFSLSGHTTGMLGFLTDDGAAFIADSLSSEATLSKYTVLYIYDVAGYVETLERLIEMKAEVFIPSHADATASIADLARKNLASTLEVADVILGFISEPRAAEEVVERVFEYYGIKMSTQQHSLIGSTVRSYLTYHARRGAAETVAVGNRLLWKAV